MLAALQIEQRHPRGWRQRIREQLRPRGEVCSRLVSTPGGHYLQVTAATGRGGRVDWREVRRVVGGEASRLLYPHRLSPPTDSGVSRFSGNALRRALMCETACHLLRIAPALARCPVVICDPQARHLPLAEALVPLAGELRVLTARPDRYRPAVEAALQRHGAALPLTDDLSCMAGAALVLAPDGIDGDPPLPRGWVLSGVEQARPRTITGYLPADYAAYTPTLPPGCDAWEYLAGLYELSGVTTLGEKPPLALCAGSRHLTPDALAGQLTGLDSGRAV